MEQNATTIFSHEPSSSSNQFEHQVAGHGKLYSIDDGYLIVKPCNAAEREFYERSVADHPEFARWLPQYYGSLKLQGVQSHLASIPVKGEDGGASSSQTSANEQQRFDIAGVDEAISIENITWKFRKPSVMDLKLGTQYWGPDATEEKRKRMTEKAARSTSAKLGIRITGMQVYKKSTQMFESCPRKYGYSLTEETILEGLSKFFLADLSANYRKIIISRFIRDLKECRKVFAQLELRMHNASLLFVYEGDEEALTEALEKERAAEVIKDHPAEEQDEILDETNKGDRTSEEDEADEDEDETDEEEGGKGGTKVTELRIIDFAHSYFKAGIGKDDGCLLGIDSALRYFEQIMNTIK